MYRYTLSPKLRSDLKKIARGYKIKHRFDMSGPSCWADASHNFFYMGLRDYHHRDWIISAFFHELMHCIVFQEGHFPIYHTIFDEWRFYSTRRLRGILTTGMRAELYVDKRAKALMKLYYPDVKFQSGYKRRDAAEWFRDYWTPTRMIYRKRIDCDD